MAVLKAVELSAGNLFKRSAILVTVVLLTSRFWANSVCAVVRQKAKISPSFTDDRCWCIFVILISC